MTGLGAGPSATDPGAICMDYYLLHHPNRHMEPNKQQSTTKHGYACYEFVADRVLHAYQDGAAGNSPCILRLPLICRAARTSHKGCHAYV